MPERVDVVVVGMGPGGEAVAGSLAEAGLSVVGVDANLLGGECPYYGCIPSKMMVRAADSLAEAHRVASLAGSAQARPDFAPVAKRIREEATTGWDDTVAVERFTGKGGRFVRGRAELLDQETVRVGDREFGADRAIVLNTGTDPAVPPVPGLAEAPYWTNRDAVRAERAPESLAVLGAGPIGLEFAQVFARFGTRVHVIELAGQVLPVEEPEAAAALAGVLEGEGLTLHTGTGAERVDHDGQRFAVRLGEETVHSEQLLVATGRRTNLAQLGLEAAGIQDVHGFLETDERMRVAGKVYAVGDITGKGGFTHVSMYQAGIATRSILGAEGPPARYHAVPRVTFTDPEVGAVGLTEAQARDRGIEVRTGLSRIPETARGWLHGPGNEGVVKLVVDAADGVLVGATAMGPSGGEVLSGLAVAVQARLPVSLLREVIYAYPTFHRGIEDAVERLH